MGNPFYLFVGASGARIFHKYIDSAGQKKSEVIRSFPIHLYVQGKERSDSSRGLMGEILNKVEFSEIDDAQEFIKEYQSIQRIHGQTNLLYQFISHRYPETVSFDFKKITILAIDIETAYDSSGFPTPQKANQQVLSIATKVFGEKQPFIVFGTKHYSRDNLTFIQCDDEEDLFRKFQRYWREINPDIVTGWNCLPTTSSIWMRDRISTLNEVQEKQELYDSYVYHVFPKSMKETWTCDLTTGHQIQSSKDHRFPVFKIPKGKYIDPINPSMIQDDLSVESISTILKDHWVYLRQELRNNVKSDLTFRQLITSNLSLLVEKGFEIVVRDSEIVRKVTAVSGKSWDTLIDSFWSIENISSLLSMKEVVSFIDRSSSIKVYSRYIHKSKIEITLDASISKDDLWMSGLWYTDGTQSYKTDVSICNKDETVASRVNDIFNTHRRRESNDIKRRSDGCFYLNTGLSRVWFWKLFIYESTKALSKKRLDAELLSQLSRDQFLSFIGGCVDGDGWIEESGVANICNYNEDINALSELLHWNGIFTTTDHSKTTIRFYTNLSDFVHHPNKKSKCKDVSVERTSKSNNLRWIMHDTYAWVRIDDITPSGSVVEMIDINTNTNYFVSQSIKTHNCEGFDIPYIVNRSNRLMGEDFTRKFSCFSDKLERCINEYSIGGRGSTYQIFGTTIIDYLELYKKYSGTTLESYRLDVVAQHELGTGKINYDDYGGLMGLYEKNYDLFIHYNKTDVELIEQLESKLNYLVLATTVAYLGKIRFSDIYSQVRFWDNHIYNALLERGIQIPPIPNNPQEEIVGAYVKDPIPALYHWVVTVDLTSLYPSIIMSANLSPETLVTPWQNTLEDVDSYLTMERDLSWAKTDNVCVIANGSTYRRDKQGIFPELVKDMFNQRKAFKKRAIQASQEIEAIESEMKRRNL